MEQLYEKLYGEFNNDMEKLIKDKKNNDVIYKYTCDLYKKIASYYYNHTICYLRSVEYEQFRSTHIKIVNCITYLKLKGYQFNEDLQKIGSGILLYFKNNKPGLFNNFEKLYLIIDKVIKEPVDKLKEKRVIKGSFETISIENDINYQLFKDVCVVTFTNSSILKYFTKGSCNPKDETKCELLNKSYDKLISLL